jgi:hypothetical protein
VHGLLWELGSRCTAKRGDEQGAPPDAEVEERPARRRRARRRVERVAVEG